VGDDSEPE